MTVVPSTMSEAKLPPSPVQADMTRRSSSRASRMATLKFLDSDSEDEQRKEFRLILAEVEPQGVRSLG